MKRTWLTTGLIVAIVGLLGAWVYSQLEQEEVTITLPGSVEARRNPLLAAQRFLQGMEQQVESVSGIAQLLSRPGSTDTVLLYGNRAPFGDTRLQRLLEWVEQGGSLVMDVDGLWEERRKQARSGLLDYLQVRLVEIEDPPEGTTEVVFDEDQTKVQVAFGQRFVLSDDGGNSSAAVNADVGSLLLQFEHGQGMITLLNDLSFIDNEHIGDHEHAYFLYLLTGTSEKLWLFYNPYSRSLADLVWQYARPLLLSLLLLGLAWLRYGNRRIGPLLPSPPPASRDLGEHVAALGRFEKQHALLAERVRITQQQVEQHWLARHPQLASLDRQARAEWIAGRTGLAVQKVVTALYGNYPDDLELTRRSAMLQQLWRSQ